jgi:hypothetical protein
MAYRIQPENTSLSFIFYRLSNFLTQHKIPLVKTAFKQREAPEIDVLL